MKVNVLDQNAKKVSETELNPLIFEAEINPPLMAQAIRVYLANQRRGTHKTKSRGEVRGGGRKPWRQKGTGRARHGSIRSPIWVGGGHTHAKHPRDYSLKIPKKMNRKALFSALTAQLKNQNLVVVSEIKIKEISTKKANQILTILAPEQKTLLVIPEKNDVLIKSFRNLPKVKMMRPRLINTYRVLSCQKIIFLQESLKILEETFLNAN